MKKIIIFLTLLVILSAMTIAVPIEMQKQIFLEQLPQIQEQFNSAPLTGPVKFFVGNEKINLYLENETISIIMKDGKIETIQSTEIEDPTLIVTASDKALLDYANNSLDMKQALKNKEITYEGVGFFNKIKFSSLGLLAKFY